MRSIPVFFRPEMSVDSRGYSPSASKSAHVVADWLASGLPIDLRTFDAATVSDLSHVHSREYVKGVLSGEIANGHGKFLAVIDSIFLTPRCITAAESRANFFCSLRTTGYPRRASTCCGREKARMSYHTESSL